VVDGVKFPQGLAGDPTIATKERADGMHAQEVRLDLGVGTAKQIIEVGQHLKANSVPTVAASDSAPGDWDTNVVEMSTAWILRIAARADRKSVEIQNQSDIEMRFGPQARSFATGYRLLNIDGVSITIEGRFDIYGAAASGTPTFCYKEVFG